jgi:transcriptional regulator NrdR
MRCPKCGCQEDKVIDSRASREGATIRRRRECIGCSHRFTTYEEVEHEGLMVLKRDGRREEFSREKLLSGIKQSLPKTPRQSQIAGRSWWTISLPRSRPNLRKKFPAKPSAKWSWTACAN